MWGEGLLRSPLALAASLLVTAFLLTGHAQDEPVGAIEGVVLHAMTGEPIAGAQIVLNPVTPALDRPRPEPATTDDQGRFVATDVPPGAYFAIVAKSGFASQIYGSRQTGIAGLAGIGNREEELESVATLLRVEAGYLLRNVVIGLTPAGTVSGRVIGSDGEPLVSMQVELFPLAYNASGRAYLIPINQADTNDRGEYRLFSVEPGRYYLGVRWAATVVARQETVNSQLRTIDARDSNGRRYAQTYFPGYASISRASVIDVGPGQEIAGIDVVMVPASAQPPRSIRGRVVDTVTGRPPESSIRRSFSLIPRDAEFLAALPSIDPNLAEDGAFELRSVMEGSYWLIVRFDASLAARVATVPLDVAGDVEGLLVNLLPTATVFGNVTLDGRPWTAADSDGFEVELNSTRTGSFVRSPGLNPSPVFFESDGTFEISNVSPGDYDVAFSGLPPDAYVAGARYANVDALAQAIPVSGGSSETLEVAISTRSGEIEGIVAGRDGKPVANTEAVLIPEGPVRRSDRYKTARTDADGRFRIRGVAPGDYKLYSWESIPRFGYFDSEFVRQFESRGKSVRVDEGTQLTVDLEMIGRD